MIIEEYFDNFPSLESEHLIFRAFTIKDASSIYAIRSNAKVMKYMDSNKHQNIEQSEKFINENFEIYKKREGIFWAITEKESEEFIGDFAFWKIDKKNHRGEIGYSLNPLYWGQGYMQEAMRKLLDFGFNKLNLHSVEANINPENKSSKNALLKMGFKKEAYFRENYFFDGKYLDSEVYCLLHSSNSCCTFSGTKKSK